MTASTLSQPKSTELFMNGGEESSESEQGSQFGGTHPNIIEHRDANFLEVRADSTMGCDLDINHRQELMRSPLIDMGAPRDIADHNEMRQKVRDVHLRLPREPVSKRIFPTASISIQSIPVIVQNDMEFSVRVYNPAVDNTYSRSGLRPALIMYHGGGWTHGLPEMDEELAKFFASELRAVVVNVDYRLAPEHPFPHPVNDCYSALNWTVDNAATYRINLKRIAIWGFSSGGNLAAAVALKDSMENTTPRIKHVNLVVPVTCHPALYPPIVSSNGASSIRFGTGKEAQLPLAAMVKLWETYVLSHPSHAYASVLHTIPPEHHPSVHITVAGCDTLRDEGIAYALRLRNHGIDTQLEIIPGVPHEIDLFPRAHASRQYMMNQVRVLNYALNTDF
ncbi:hypothetical protein CLAIMM_11142 [Cladophialophora immunda]|nr:hypothetical protein CLAIMM_11142 [Cladophialophora immunda]